MAATEVAASEPQRSARVSLSLCVVPEAEPTHPVSRPLIQNLFFRFKSSVSGHSKRQPHKFSATAHSKQLPTRQPLINDPHMRSLYSDKVLAERKLNAKERECADWKARCLKAESASVIAVSDQVKAWATCETIPKRITDGDQLSKLQWKLKSAEQVATAARADKARAEAAREEALEEKSEALAEKSVALKRAADSERSCKQVSNSLESAVKRTASALSRAAHAIESVREISAEAAAAESALKGTARELAKVRRSLDISQVRCCVAKPPRTPHLHGHTSSPYGFLTHQLSPRLLLATTA